MLLLTAKEGVFERPKTLMGLRQLHGNRVHNHLLLRHVLFGLGGPIDLTFNLSGLNYSAHQMIW